MFRACWTARAEIERATAALLDATRLLHRTQEFPRDAVARLEEIAGELEDYVDGLSGEERDKRTKFTSDERAELQALDFWDRSSTVLRWQTDDAESEREAFFEMATRFHRINPEHYARSTYSLLGGSIDEYDADTDAARQLRQAKVRVVKSHFGHADRHLAAAAFGWHVKYRENLDALLADRPRDIGEQVAYGRTAEAQARKFADDNCEAWARAHGGAAKTARQVRADLGRTLDGERAALTRAQVHSQRLADALGVDAARIQGEPFDGDNALREELHEWRNRARSTREPHRALYEQLALVRGQRIAATERQFALARAYERHWRARRRAERLAANARGTDGARAEVIDIGKSAAITET